MFNKVLLSRAEAQGRRDYVCPPFGGDDDIEVLKAVNGSEYSVLHQ